MERFNPQLLHMMTGPHFFARSHFERYGEDPSEPFPQEGKQNAIALFEAVHQECVKTGLRTSALTASRILQSMKEDKDLTRKKHIDLIEELSHRVVDELTCEFFLQLTLSEADRYENWRKGWETVLERLPEATRDVEEMNKCFALARYTASMFHALQVAEWGAIKLGEFIGVTDPKRAWRATEKRLRELVDNGHNNLPESLAGRFEFLEQMNREIDSMVLAWRNKVDHAANRLAILPNTDFTPDIAEHIIGAVRIFMLRLLEGLP